MLNIFIQSLIQNLQIIGIAFGFLGVTILANISAKTYYNTKHLKQEFDSTRLMNGFLKLLSIGLSTALISIPITLLPNIEILSDIITEDFSFLCVILIYGKQILKYGKDTLETLNNIADKNNIIEDSKE